MPIFPMSTRMRARLKREYQTHAVWWLLGTGHIMYLEKPTEVSRLVINFIEQNSN